MATKIDLSTAFDNQGNAMPQCCAGAQGQLGGDCLGLSGRRMQMANNVGAWNALPATSQSYDPVIAGLNQSTAQLSAAGSNEACIAAIAQAHVALDGLQALLG